MALPALARCSLGLVSIWLCSPPKPSIVPKVTPVTFGLRTPTQDYARALGQQYTDKEFESARAGERESESERTFAIPRMKVNLVAWSG